MQKPAFTLGVRKSRFKESKNIFYTASGGIIGFSPK